MPKRLDDEELLELLQRKEDAASHYIHGELGNQREMAMREYHRMPYGNEPAGIFFEYSTNEKPTVRAATIVR
jgi:hypothetical protein